MNTAQLDSGAAALRAAIHSWNPPAITGVGTVHAARKPQDMSSGERRVWQEAEAAGRAAGMEAARQEIELRKRQHDSAMRSMEAALQALSRPLAQVDDAVHGQIAMLAGALARALVRRELRVEPTQIIGIVRDTVGLLPAAARGVRVLLHPDDAALVRERLNVSGQDQAWSIVDDPGLSRGDCRVHTEFAQIDARIETRLNEAMAALLGDERTGERNGEQA